MVLTSMQLKRHLMSFKGESSTVRDIGKKRRRLLVILRIFGALEGRNQNYLVFFKNIYIYEHAKRKFNLLLLVIDLFE